MGTAPGGASSAENSMPSPRGDTGPPKWTESVATAGGACGSTSLTVAAPGRLRTTPNGPPEVCTTSTTVR